MRYIPLKMRPHYKNFLWGGNKLADLYNKKDAPCVCAESWELSCNPDGETAVIEGPFDGKTVSELGRLDHDGFWGNKCEENMFPVIVKMIDARSSLSIQVHPSDKDAKIEYGERGKAELWYILDCDKDAYIYLGLTRLITKSEFLTRAADGSICSVLNKVPVRKGNVFYINPGVIHAIGAGVVLIEVQQNSNTTFRIYDYDRVDQTGKTRQLNVKRATEVIDYMPLIPRLCRNNCAAVFPGYSTAELYSSGFFKVHELTVRDDVTLTGNNGSFKHLVCIEGDGHILSEGERYPFIKGESYFIPAKTGNIRICGECRMILTHI